MWYALMPLMAYKSFGSYQILIVGIDWKVGIAKPTLCPEAIAVDLVGLTKELLKA
jgi:hypothetical protein